MSEIDKILGTIQQAIEIEKFGYDFYTHMRSFVKDKDGHKLLSYIADLEIDHMKWLEEEYKRQLKKLEEFNEEPAPHISITGKEEIFFKDKLPDIFKKFDSKKALNFAIDVENRSIEFYENNLNQTDDEQLKELFKKLADFERDHISILNNTLKSLESEGAWMSPALHILW